MINIAINFATYSSLLCVLASSFVWLWGTKRLIRHRVVTLFVSCRHSYTPVSANEINNVTTKNLYFPTRFRPQSSLLRLLASSFVWLWGIKRLIRHTLVTLFVSCRHSYTPVSANEINNVTTKKPRFPHSVSPPVVALASAGVVVRLVVGYQTPNPSQGCHSFRFLSSHLPALFTQRDK